MKTYEHIQPAELVEVPAPDGEVWKQDQLTLKLTQEGHKPISVGRATMIVTQCELGDEFPKGWCEEPLRIAVYADPDVSGTFVPYEVFLHGGRFGLMETYFRINREDGSYSDRILTPIDTPSGHNALQNPDPMSVVEALRQIAQLRLDGMYYSVRSDEGVTGVPVVDPTLAYLGEQVVKSLEAYRDYISLHTT